MKIPTVSSFCGCLSLKTGTLIITSLNLTIALLAMMACCLFSTQIILVISNNFLVNLLTGVIGSGKNNLKKTLTIKM